VYSTVGTGPWPLPEHVITVRSPASAANLGPGFDVLGLALDAGEITIDVEPAQETELVATGEGAASLPCDERNRCLVALRRMHGGPVRIRAHSTIPLERGLGSSAAAAVAGLTAGAVLAGADPDALPIDLILAQAAEMEGHAENAAAALLGGFVVAGPGLPVTRLAVPEAWRFVVAIPRHPINTSAAREALPGSWPRDAVVRNLGRVALLVAAVACDRGELLAAALDDELHQPYRTQLFAAWEMARSAACAAGAAGVVWSGAGSSLLAILDRADAAPVLRALATTLPDADVRETRPSPGTTVVT